jgi:hypothetical protein
VRQVALLDSAGEQPGAQRVGRDDRILDGVVDADPKDRRHDVRRVANEQESGCVPPLDSASLHVEQRRLVPVLEQIQAVRQPRRKL